MSWRILFYMKMMRWGKIKTKGYFKNNFCIKEINTGSANSALKYGILLSVRGIVKKIKNFMLKVP